MNSFQATICSICVLGCIAVIMAFNTGQDVGMDELALKKANQIYCTTKNHIEMLCKEEK